MKFNRKTLASSIAASVLAASCLVPVANAEVSGSVGIASTYLWRGLDLGSGTPAVSGDLKYSMSGFYTGIWGSSGDTAAGTEYDLYAGYGGSVGGFSYDVSLWNYVYPTDDDAETDIGDLTDLVVSLGFGPVALGVYKPVSNKDGDSGDYVYYTLSGSVGAFSLLAGLHSDGPCPSDTSSESCDPLHVNFSYAYNDNLSFTFSQFISDEPDGDDLKFVVSYSLPIGE